MAFTNMVMMALVFDHTCVCRVAVWAVRVLRRMQLGPSVSCAFTAWVAAVRQRRIARKMSALALLHRCSGLYQRAMAVWVAASAWRRLKRTALAHWQRQTVAAGFNVWRNAAHEVRCENLRLSQAMLHWKGSCLRYVDMKRHL